MRKKGVRKGISITVLAALLLSACGAKTQTAPSEVGGSQTPETKTEQTSGGNEAAEGKTEEPLKITGMANLFNLAPEKNGDFWIAMEEKFNVDYTVDWVPVDTYQQKQELILSSGELPDLMQITNTSLPSYQKAVEAGAFYDLTDLLGDFSEYPNLKNNTNLNAWTLSKIKGRNYIVPRTRGNLDSALMVRKDWLDKLGLEVPKTVDEFAVVIEQIANGDPDGNGINDTIGLVPGIDDIDGYWPAAFGTREIVKDSDGGIIYERLTDQYANYVEYMRDLYSKGAVAKEFALIKGQQQEE